MNNNVVEMVAVGDISFGDFPFCVGYGVRSSIKKNGADSIFENVKSVLDGKDIVFGNLETVLSNKGLDINELKSLEMRGDPMVIPTLKECNFNVLNMANNHIMQHGEAAFEETAALLGKNGIAPLGLAANDEWHSKPLILEKKGIKFGFLGYAYETDKYHKGHLLYAFGKPEAIRKDIEKLKPKVDFLIVSYHWGLEFIDRPSVANIRLAHQTIDWGANVILGHHPHVLQGIEEYKEGLILYSLGNFLFDMNWNKIFQRSMVVDIRFEKNKKIHYNFKPVVIRELYQPHVAKETDEMVIRAIVEKLSEKIKAQMQGDTEYNSYIYYLEFERMRKKNRYESYRYFLANLHRYEFRILLQIVKRTILRKIDSIKNLFKSSFA